MEKLFLGYIRSKKVNLIHAVEHRKIKSFNKTIILSLIKSGNLDSIIDEINEKKVSTVKSSLQPKGTITGYEQFISVLDKFITYSLGIIDSPELIETIILNCIKNKKIFLSRKYVYDIDNIDYYQYHFNKIIGDIFYNNLMVMRKDLRIELDYLKLNLEDNNIDYIVNILGEIVFINRNDYKALSLFTKITDERYTIFLHWYKMLFNKYINNKDLVLLYRNFKNSN